MNCHKSEAHARVPAEIMIGRKLFLPFEIDNIEIEDHEGK